MSSSLTFATFNVLNLQRAGKDLYRSGDAWTKEAVAAKLAWIAEKLTLLDADVVGFQEIWHAETLAKAFEEAGLSDAYDLHAIDANPRQPQCALAVRKGWTVGEPRWEPDFPATFDLKSLRESQGAGETISISIKQFSRPILIADVRPPSVPANTPAIRVYVAHLKSKGPTQFRTPTGAAPHAAIATHREIVGAVVSHVRRLMEAGALRAHLDAYMKQENVLSPTVVMGDLNDGTYSVSNEVISSQPTYKVFASSGAGQRSNAGLYSCETLQQYRSHRDVYYTYVHENKFETLDHIFVSQEFYDHSTSRLWSFVRMAVFNDHVTIAEGDDVKDLQRTKGLGDHGIVRAEFTWNPARPR